jgi:hypothetical protein
METQVFFIRRAYLMTEAQVCNHKINFYYFSKPAYLMIQEWMVRKKKSIKIDSSIKKSYLIKMELVEV